MCLRDLQQMVFPLYFSAGLLVLLLVQKLRLTRING